MAGTSGRILKSEDIILDGQYHLDMGRTEKDKNEPPQKNAVSAPVRACILEDHPEYAVLEVICVCGMKICLRCEYSNAKGSNDVTEAT
jgi:hypothetical protein